MRQPRVVPMWAIGAGLGLSLLAAPAAAQSTSGHQGFWIGFGFGGGSNLTTTLDGGSTGGFAMSLRLGGTLRSQWLLGGESSAWMREVDTDTWAYRSNLSALVMYYPNASGGFFVKAGPGFAVLDESSTISVQVDGVEVSTSVSAMEIGFGGTFGAGYDLKIGRNLYLVPEVTYLLQTFDGRATNTPLGTIPGANSLLLFTLGLTWH